MRGNSRSAVGEEPGEGLGQFGAPVGHGMITVKFVVVDGGA